MGYTIKVLLYIVLAPWGGIASQVIVTSTNVSITKV